MAISPYVMALLVLVVDVVEGIALTTIVEGRA